MIVSNSSPIISLGTVGRLELFQKCFQEVAIPSGVYDEISMKRDSPEFISLQKGIEERWIKVEKAELLPTLKTNRLGNGEKEAISLAAKHKSILVIDDDSAKTYAEIVGVESHGTLYVLTRAKNKGFLSRSEAIHLLGRMMEAGFYISTLVYGKFLEEI
ncbi:DUF3368 domain-containing protein [Candidatus Woesearchaeota archaeon]|nr:DUF3368 domain-containing protein [Candidatus Woesearchaeota archaeon]